MLCQYLLSIFYNSSLLSLNYILFILSKIAVNSFFISTVNEMLKEALKLKDIKVGYVGGFEAKNRKREMI